MRVLLTSTPGAGHLLPLAPLALALRSAGHQVRWATGADARLVALAAGVHPVAAGPDLESRTRRFREGWSHVADLPPREQRAATFPVLFGTLSARLMYDDLLRVTDADPPDVIVHEPCELAAAPLARRLGIPHVTVGYGRTVPPALLAAAATEVAPLWHGAGAPPPSDCGVFEHLYLHPLPAGFEPVPSGAPVSGLRPLHEHDWRTTTSRPPGGPPLLYVTFGTEFGHRAPWRAVMGAISSLPVRALVTIGERVDPEALGPVPSSVRVERWVAQRDALADADLVVSHGGSGAMIGALAAALPHLALPLGADHFDNADLIASLGVGAALEPDRQLPSTLAGAIAQLLGHEATHRRVRVASDELAGLPTPEAAVRQIEALVGRVHTGGRSA